MSTGLVRVHADQLELTVDASGRLVVLGEGKHNMVFKGRLQGMDVAAKVTEVLPGSDVRQLWSEVVLLHRSAHPRILPLLGVAVKGNLLILATQLMAGGSLQAALQNPATREKLRWHAGGRQVAVDVAEGLHFLHTQAGVQHNDLKSRNVLLTEELRACISDLGMSSAVCSQARTVAGLSLAYAAPEQLLGKRCTQAADMFSFGVLLIELTTQAVFAQRDLWRLPSVPSQCSQAALDLIEQCILPDPDRRPSAAEALQRLRADAVASCQRDGNE